jgi:hypothetical protein
MLALFRYFEAARLSAKLGNQDEALVFAERGLEIDEDCLGKDHVLYRKSYETVQSWR